MIFPEPFMTFMWLVIAAAILVGGVYLFIHLGWSVYYRVDIMSTQARAEEDLIRVRAEHQRKLLDLEYEKTKVMNESIIAAGRETT